LRAPQTTAKSKITGWQADFDPYEPSLAEAKAACERFVADMERGGDPYWLTLQGTFGCGKTYLLQQVFQQAKRINPGNPANNPIWPPDALQSWGEGVNTYTSSRPYALRLDEGGMVSRMRNGDHDYPRRLRDDFFVAFDELGIARDPTNYVAEAVATLAEMRLNRWTMIATNLSLEEIAERMDARISSRIVRHNHKLVSITAGDYALRD